MVGLFVAAAIVTLLQFLRVRDRRLLPLAAMFAFQSQALSREWYDVWRDVFQAGVCAAGLLLVLMLSPRHAPRPSAPDVPLRQPVPASPPLDEPPAPPAAPVA